MECKDVMYAMAVPDDREHRAWVPGDLVYDPKMGEGHIIVGTKRCDGGDFYCGYCVGMLTTASHYCEADWPVCECGKFDAGDHHGFTLRRADDTGPPAPGEGDGLPNPELEMEC